MPSFLNPLEMIVGGTVDIPVGSKWKRVKLGTRQTLERFLGQEVVVVPTPWEWGAHYVWIKRKRMDGLWDSPKHLSREDFVVEFEPFVINLENK